MTELSYCPVAPFRERRIDRSILEQYNAYIRLRIEHLLARFRRHRDFPGVQTGFNALTGRDFAAKDLLSYSWINGRGAFVFARFAATYAQYNDELMAYALHSVEWMEDIARRSHGRIPFAVPPDIAAFPVAMPGHVPTGVKTYSDLFACLGFLEYGVRARDSGRIGSAKRMFEEIITALRKGLFVNEPTELNEGLVSENFWSTALDVANEFYRQLGEAQYLDVAFEIADVVMKTFYRQELGTIIEYSGKESKPDCPEGGPCTVDPGHVIELAGFFLILLEAGAAAGKNKAAVERIGALAPNLIRWSLENGWNAQHAGIYKTIDARTKQPIDDSMPWWSLPETMLSTWLAYEWTGDEDFLEWYRRAHDAYFIRYLNPRTQWAPYQTLDGRTGVAIDVPPACKFQDPEYHSGRNLLTLVKRIGKRLSVTEHTIEWRAR